jgi:hypothetical protein
MGSTLASLSVAAGFPFQAPGPGGAGRYRSYTFPDVSGLFVTTTSPSNAGVRGRIATGGPGILSSAFGGGFTALPGLVNGLAGLLITNNPGSGCIRLQGQICNVKTARTHVQPAVADDSTCYRVWANLACSNGAPNTNDQGLYMIQPGGVTPRIIIDGGAGFGFLVGQTGIVSFVVRGPNGLIITPLTAAPFDVTAHHTYEMLIAGMTPTSNGSLTALIDGIVAPLPALSRTWGPGTNLPPNVTFSAESGFVPAIISSNGILNSTVHAQQVTVAFGPTIGSLL